MSRSLNRVRNLLESAEIEAKVVEMAAETRTARDAANSIGCKLDQIVKSIVLLAPDRKSHWLFLTAGGNLVDMEKARALAGVDLVRADAGSVRAKTGFAIGGVAPIAHKEKPIAYFDRRLSDFDIVWSAAGTPRHVFGLNPGSLKGLAGAADADFTESD
ncbi:MAG: YbaK/EbsC family protein [Albidovulum sp.]|nr:YbaK/EbsC family protein [Albidovulum sp.]MDE0305362.1 YbaK/EbsC family protein [Albidovulum sp.]MDE0530937.1 YbaK/EbsC family protein [Albidovulum sp.]